MMLPSTPEPSSTKIEAEESKISTLPPLPMRMSFSQAKELVAQEQDDAVVEECSAYEPTWEP